MHYNLVAENPESTVVAEYQSAFSRERTYKSEAALEKAFIEQLQTQAYEYYRGKLLDFKKINCNLKR
jgi:type I restriction enzyme R subunit